MKQQDTLKYILENLRRAKLLDQRIQEKKMNEVVLRDHLVQRNSFLNKAIKVANTELGYSIVPVRYRQLNITREFNGMVQLLAREYKKEESADAL